MVRGLYRLATERSQVQLLALRFPVATSGRLFAHMCLCHQAVKFGTVQGALNALRLGR